MGIAEEANRHACEVRRRLRGLPAAGVVSRDRVEPPRRSKGKPRASAQAKKPSVPHRAWEAGYRLGFIAGITSVAYVADVSSFYAPRPTKTLREIVLEVADKHDVSVKEMMSHRRHRSVARARQEFYFRAKDETGNSYPQIGAFLGGRDHTTVLHGVRRFLELLAAERQETELVIREKAT